MTAPSTSSSLSSSVSTLEASDACASLPSSTSALSEAPAHSGWSSAHPGWHRPVIQGKFIYVGQEKFYIKGVTYGPFKPTADGCEYHDVKRVQADFARMAANGINAVRTYTVPPRWLLDLAQQQGLRVMIGLPWEQHIAFLDDAKRRSAIEDRVRQQVRTCAGHPAILAYTVGNEIPPSIVRWHGAPKIQAFIHRLFRIIKKQDPHGLVTYVNFPTTEYLDLPFLDFLAFNVYLEAKPSLMAYMAKLQSHAGDRPLLMAELGLDSIRNGLEGQAQSLDWQIRAGFEAGCCGLFVFAWSDRWYRGGAEIEDWSFGLIDRQGQAKPALAAVVQAFSQIPYSRDRAWPKISVVVCTYNGSRTIRDCCQGLQELTYPNFEVIVVDDGSKDGVGDIAAQYGFKVIRKPNGGLSSARNVGMEAATGEIVAYLDDDARPDPHWLDYLAHTYMTTNHAAVGGPNIPPQGDGPIADCVANAPGGPIHVLMTDEIAEHVPGCNLSVRRACLQAVTGFDPTFRIAGDDVDLCWRLQEQGWTIGFSPAAMVWHHRRNSVKAYLKQQLNYGRAEAMLERKWPSKYNAAGHVPWLGRLYGKGMLPSFQFGRGRIYQGVWGQAPFQSLYQPAPGLISSLPLMPEWYLIIAALAAMSAMGTFWPPLWPALPVLLLALSAPLIQAMLGGARAVFINPPRSSGDLFHKRCLTSLLHLLQPMVRFYGRVRGGLHPMRPRGTRKLALPLRRRIVQWFENWSSSDAHLLRLEQELENSGAAVRRGGEFDRWDLRVSGGLLGGARLRIGIEEHGQGRQQVLWAIWPTWSPLGLTIVALFGLLAFLAGCDAYRSESWHGWVATGVLGMSSLAMFLKAMREAGYCVGSAIQSLSPKKETGHADASCGSVMAQRPTLPEGADSVPLTTAPVLTAETDKTASLTHTGQP